MKMHGFLAFNAFLESKLGIIMDEVRDHKFMVKSSLDISGCVEMDQNLESVVSINDVQFIEKGNTQPLDLKRSIKGDLGSITEEEFIFKNSNTNHLPHI